MSHTRIEIAIEPSRHGWGVVVDSDRVSLHKRLEDAREEAEGLVVAHEDLGEDAVFIDRSLDAND